MPHLDAEIRPRLHDGGQAISKPTQVVDDVSAVTEEKREEPYSADPRDRPVHPVVKAIQRIDPVRLDEQVQYARNGADEQEADERDAEEEHQGEDQRFGEEPRQRHRTGARTQIQHLRQRRHHARNYRSERD